MVHLEALLHTVYFGFAQLKSYFKHFKKMNRKRNLILYVSLSGNFLTYVIDWEREFL